VPAGRPVAKAFETIIADPRFKAARDRGASTVWMPRLGCMHEVNARTLSFAAAEEGRVRPDQERFGPWNRQQVAVWRRAMTEAFAPVRHWLP
jgi:hypothetical protein